MTGSYLAVSVRTMAVLPLVRATGPRDDPPMQIDIVLYDGFDELDALAPYEVFQSAAVLGADIQAELVGAHGGGTITADHGARIVVDRGPSDACDMVLVPGGGWNTRSEIGARGEAQRGDLPARIASLHAAGKTIASVCTGAMLLAAAGITYGRPATTHHSAVADLRASGANVMDARVVDDGDVITAGGVTSGIDLALLIVEQQAGADIAGQVAREIEYERQYHDSRLNA
jgi:transcriptional regulator GlxA family with amidase domain